MPPKPPANLLRIAASPGACRREFVCDRLNHALASGGLGMLVSLDPEVDPYGSMLPLLRTDTAVDGANLATACARVNYFGCSALRNLPREAAMTRLRQAMQPIWSRPALDGQRKGGKGVLIVDGCQWLFRPPIDWLGDQVVRWVRAWVESGGDLIAIGRDARDTEFLAPIPIVQMRSKLGEELAGQPMSSRAARPMVRQIEFSAA